MKRLIVTGAAGGIGLATVSYLAGQGYYVYALDCKKVMPMANVESYVCDLTSEKEIKDVCESIRHNGKIYGIIHLCGTYCMDSLIEIDEARLRKALDVNFFSVYLVNRVFLELLETGGKIVITSSEVAPLDPLPFNGIYSLTKNTVENYASSLRQELNLLDIKVIVLRPGAVNTGLIVESVENVERIERETVLYKENAPLFRKIVERNESSTVEPSEVAKLAGVILKKRRPRLVYTINLNPRLILLSALPKRLQMYIVKKLITPRHRKI